MPLQSWSATALRKQQCRPGSSSARPHTAWLAYSTVGPHTAWPAPRKGTVGPAQKQHGPSGSRGSGRAASGGYEPGHCRVRLRSVLGRLCATPALLLFGRAPPQGQVVRPGETVIDPVVDEHLQLVRLRDVLR